MRPRVAHVISTRGVGGAERFLAALVASGHARNWDQLVLNPFANPGSAGLMELCHPVAYESYSCERAVGIPGLRRWLKRRLNRFEPDIVHVLLFHALVVTATLPKRPGVATLLTHAYGNRFQPSPRGRIFRQVDRIAGSRFDRVVAISESVRQFLVSDHGYPDAKVTCIPLGWEGNPLPRCANERPPTVVCVAGLRPEKGHDVLLSAMALVRRQVPDARLLLIGEGACRRSLEAQAATLGIAGGVMFLGSVPDIWSHLAEADVFAIASRSEAFGIAIAEAMAAGLPVVGPAVGGIPELVRPGVTGALFPPGDCMALASELVRLLQSANLRSQMGAAAQAVAKPLRMENAVERYFGVYEELLELTGTRRDPRSSPPTRAWGKAPPPSVAG